MMRIANPQSIKRLGHFLTLDCKSSGTPNRLYIHRSVENVGFYTFLIPLLCNSTHFPHLSSFNLPHFLLNLFYFFQFPTFKLHYNFME